MSTTARSRSAVLALIISLAAVVLAAGPARATVDPGISGGRVSEHETVLDAWYRILDAFPDLGACLSTAIPDVVIGPSSHVGIYDFRIDTIFLRAGGFGLPDAVHEFAHHLDWECGFGAGDEDGLFATTDLAEHLRDTGWQYQPLEIFAETVVKLVLGPEASSAGGRASGLHPSPEAQAFVAAWGDRGRRTETPRIRAALMPVPN